MTPMAMPPPSGSEAVSSPPAESRRESAEKASSSPFWMMIDRPKVISSGGRMSAPIARLRMMACKQVADREHQRQRDQRGQRQRQAEKRDQRQDQEGRQHDQVAMREVDQPHDAEDQRQSGREQRVEPAEQDALDDHVEERGHRPPSMPEIGGVDLVARQRRPARPTASCGPPEKQ